MRIKTALIAALLFLMGSAYAEVHTYNMCQLNEGKTPQDAYTALAAGSAYMAAQGVNEPLTTEIMWRFFPESGLGEGSFVVHRVAKDWGDLGGAFKQLWDEGKMFGPEAPENDAYTCSGSQVWWTNPRM